MGVNLYLLDRRPVTLVIGGSRHIVGMLRRFFKITEMDTARSAECAAAGEIKPSPVAVMNIDVVEMPLANETDGLAPAHLVLGWDEGRGSVTDFRWDYLPLLGYAVRENSTGSYILHEERSGRLHVMDIARAHALHLLDANGQLLRIGQPRVVECRKVVHYITGYAEADCTFDNGSQEKLVISVGGASLPEPGWLIGKTPMETQHYPPRPPTAHSPGMPYTPRQ